MILGKEIMKEVRSKERFFNEYLEEAGKVYLEYSFKMNNANREPEDRFRILLYPKNSKAKLVFYSDGLGMSTGYKSMSEQLKEYCTALEGVEGTEEEYRKVWVEVTREYYTGLNLIKVDLSSEFIENQVGNNILTILGEKDISIREMAIALDRDYAGMHRLVNRETLETTQLGTLLEIAEYLNVDIQDLYK